MIPRLEDVHSHSEIAELFGIELRFLYTNTQNGLDRRNPMASLFAIRCGNHQSPCGYHRKEKWGNVIVMRRDKQPLRPELAKALCTWIGQRLKPTFNLARKQVQEGVYDHSHNVKDGVIGKKSQRIIFSSTTKAGKTNPRRTTCRTPLVRRTNLMKTNDRFEASATMYNAIEIVKVVQGGQYLDVLSVAPTRLQEQLLLGMKALTANISRNGSSAGEVLSLSALLNLLTSETKTTAMYQGMKGRVAPSATENELFFLGFASSRRQTKGTIKEFLVLRMENKKKTCW